VNIRSEKIEEPFYAVELQVNGKLTTKDYEALVPIVETLIMKRKISLLVELLDFHGWSVGALWEDTKFAAKHFKNIERIAIVGDKLWERGMAAFCKPFTSADVRFFDYSDIDQAREWINQSEMENVEPSHLSG
jgi:uncharacterized membrane protein